MTESYEASVICTNCGDGAVDMKITKGKLVSDALCPNCQCKCLVLDC